jgi:hypothetical protein
MDTIIILTELILMNHIHWSKETWVEVHSLYTNLHVTLYIEHAFLEVDDNLNIILHDLLVLPLPLVQCEHDLEEKPQLWKK